MKMIKIIALTGIAALLATPILSLANSCNGGPCYMATNPTTSTTSSSAVTTYLKKHHNVALFKEAKKGVKSPAYIRFERLTKDGLKIPSKTVDEATTQTVIDGDTYDAVNLSTLNYATGFTVSNPSTIANLSAWASSLSSDELPLYEDDFGATTTSENGTATPSTFAAAGSWAANAESLTLTLQEGTDIIYYVADGRMVK